MRLSYLIYTLSLVMFYFSFVLLFPAIVGCIYGEQNSILPFLLPSVLLLVFSLVLKFVIKKYAGITEINDIKKPEGLCVVVFSWLIAGFFASVPYMFFDLSPINALFEATSGITATGATIFTHFNFPKALFFWRSFSQWLGGMGIVVLFIAILPQFAVAGRQLFFAEAPGPTEDKFTPRIKNTASALWRIYFGMTFAEVILLKFCGIDLFNSVCIAFSSVSGGGFSTDSLGLIRYSNVVFWIICIFMFFSGASYNLQYRAWSKFNFAVFLKNEEFRVYFLVFFIIGALLTCSLFANSHYNCIESITHAYFQVASFMSTSGFCSINYDTWDYTSKALLMFAIFAGSCASSAGGGVKVLRWLLIFKLMKTELIRILHPKAVFNVKIGDFSVSQNILYQTLMFVSFYIMFLLLSSILVAIIEKNTTVGLMGALCSMGNIGPAIGNSIGATGNYNGLHALSKLILIFDMYVGRLELIPFLVLFQKDIWKFR